MSQSHPGRVRRLWRSLLVFVVVAVVVVHAVAGWVFSERLVVDAFTPPADKEFGDPSQTVLVIDEVEYQSPVGPIDAWFVDGVRDEWVIHVHGKGAQLNEAVGLAEALAGEGYPQLIIGYRNDAGQPLDPSGFYGYGTTEWQDLAAAVDFALSRGAENVALVGYSTGAAITLAYLYRTPAAPVRAVVFDAPNADMSATIDLAATRERLAPGVPVPVTVTEIAKTIAALRTGVNWDALDYVRRLDALAVPALVFHGTADTVVPVDVSQRMDDARPRLIELVVVEGAEHVTSRAADPSSYDTRVIGFLATHWP